MRFLETPISAQTELSDSLLRLSQKNEFDFDKKKLIQAVKEKRLYLDNSLIKLLPHKVFKKGKAQIYFDLPGWTIQDEDILFEDKWMIAVNKPSGLPSQASLTFLQDHAYGAVMCMLRERKPFVSPSLFLMHRLDMDTSGALLMSKKASANKGLQDLFEKKQIQKIYWAISNNTEKPLKKITSHLGRKPDETHNFKFASFPENHPGVKYAETDFKLLSQSENQSLYQVRPKTGRSHQIRVHMSENRHPILGDQFYKGSEASRLFLHAKSLSFTHPMTQEKIEITAPIDSDWASLLDKNQLNP